MVSPAALIVVSLAGICGFALPNRDFTEAVRLWRLGMTVLSSVAGLFGLTVGLIALIIHLAGLTSMGVAYLAPFSRIRGVQLYRSRLTNQKYRDPALHPRDRKNQR